MRPLVTARLAGEIALVDRLTSWAPAAVVLPEPPKRPGDPLTFRTGVRLTWES